MACDQRWLCSSAVGAVLALALMPAPGVGPTARAADDPPPRIDTVFPHDRQIQIEWRETWGATYDHYRRQWRSTLAEAHRSEAVRDLRLNARLLDLLRRALQRSAVPESEHAAIYRQAEAHLGDPELAAYAGPWLRGGLASMPGDHAAATAALRRLLAIIGEHGAWMPEVDRWRGYAVRRVAALHRLGYLPAAHPLVLRALGQRAAAALEAGRWLQADQYHQRILAHAPRHAATRLDQARLMLRLGRPERALAELNDPARRDDAAFRALREHAQAVARIAAQRVDREASMPLDHADAPGRPRALRAIAPRHARSTWRPARSEPNGAQGRADAPDAVNAPDVADAPDDAGPARALRRAVDQRDDVALMRLYRTRPDTRIGGEALAAHGRLALQAGRLQHARRSFSDLLEAAPTAALRRTARLGLMLAGGATDQTPAPAEPERLTWFDRTIEPTDLQKRLRRPASDGAWADAPAASRGDPPELALPGGFREAALFRVSGGWLALAAHGVARLDDAGQPSWIHQPAAPWPAAIGDRGAARASADVRHVGPKPRGTVGMIHDPVGRHFRTPIVVRTGQSAPQSNGGAVTAIDGRSGRMRWHAAEDAWWQARRPVGQPTAAEGRVYVLAVDDDARREGRRRLWLTCLDLATGRRVWTTALGAIAPTVEAAPGSNHAGQRFDFTTHRAAITVTEGAVYFDAAAGLVGRCDARDGMIAWLRTYSPGPFADDLPTLLAPRGPSRPVVLDQRVCFTTPDRVGVLSVDRGTGGRAWSKPRLGEAYLLAGGDGRVISARGVELARWDAITGEVGWTTALRSPVTAVRSVGLGVRLRTADGWYRLNPDTGAVEPGASDDAVDAFARRLDGDGAGAGRWLPVRTTHGPMRPGMSEAAAVTTVGPVLSGRLTRLPAVRGGLWVAPGRAPRVYSVASGELAAIDVQQEAQVRWRAQWSPADEPANDEQPPHATDAERPVLVMQEGAVYVLDGRHLLAVDDRDGRIRWRLRLPGRGSQILRSGSRLLVAGFHDRRFVAMIRRRTGAVIWMRHLHALGPDSRLDRLGEHAGRVQVLGRLTHRGAPEPGGYHRIAMDPADGSITRIDALRPADAESQPIRARLVGRYAWLAAADERLVRVDLDRPEMQQAIQADLRPLDPARLVADEIVGRFWRLAQARPERDRWRQWLIATGEPGRVLISEHPVAVRGDWVLAIDDPVVHVNSIPQRGRITSIKAGKLDPAVTSVRVLDGWTYATGFLLASVQQDRDTDRAWIGLHRFTRAGKAAGEAAVMSVPAEQAERLVARRGGTLSGARPWRYHAGLLLMPGGDGRVAIDVGRSLQRLDQTPPLIRRAPAAIAIDGRLDDWPEAWQTRTDARGRPVRWQARRDGDRLALAIASTDARIDAEPAGHGDRLTLMLRQGGRHMRLAIRHTPNGPMVTASRDGGPPRPGPAHGIRAAVGGDPRQPSHVYELSLPLADWFTPGDEPTRTLRFAAALWDRAHHDGRHPLVVLPAPGGGSLRWPMP